MLESSDLKPCQRYGSVKASSTYIYCSICAKASLQGGQASAAYANEAVGGGEKKKKRNLGTLEGQASEEYKSAGETKGIRIYTATG